MKQVVILLVLLISTSLVKAQEKKSYEEETILDLSVSVGDKMVSSALSLYHLHGIGKKKKRFAVGYGIRYTGFFGSQTFYTTAPSKYTSSVQGITTLFSETYLENIDTVAISSPQVNSVNLSIHLQYSIFPKFAIGFNIDAVGFSVGSEKKTSILSSVYDAGQPPLVLSRPTTLNLLLTSDNDIGSLNSELYLQYWFTDRIALRGGYMFYFSEYTTNTPLSFDERRIINDRFRLKSSLFLLALSWKPFIPKK